MTETVWQGDRTVAVELTEGETLRFFVEYVGEDGSTPVNITGATPRIYVKPNASVLIPTWDLQVGSGLAVMGSEGRISVTLSSSQTDDKVGTYVFDIRLQFANGDVFFLAGGLARVMRAVTDIASAPDYIAPFDPGPVNSGIVIRGGMTLRVRARGPVIVPVPSGSTGPLPFLDFVLGTGYLRVSPSPLALTLDYSVGTGVNAIAQLDLLKPNGEALGVIAAAGPGLAYVVGNVATAVTHFDFTRADGQTMRLTAAADNSNNIEWQIL